MAEHSLAIHRFQTRIALTGLSEDGPPLGREIGRAVREILPAALGGMLEPLLGSRDGVLRIDRIALRLRLGRGDFSAVRIADLIARAIARAVHGRAGSADAASIGGGLAFWPDHITFAASYVAHRLGLMGAPAWAFPDFRALDLLAPSEAALELIAARPAILAALARLFGTAAAPRLAAALPEQTAALLIERLIAGLPSALPRGAEAELVAMLGALPAAIEAGPARAALAAAAATLADNAATDAEAVRCAVMLARLAVALAALRKAVSAWGRRPAAADLAPEALPRLPEPARRLTQAALAPLSGAGSVREALARALNVGFHRDSRADAVTEQAALQVETPRSIASRIAGIGLLMPAAQAHDLPELLSPAALHRTLAAALGPEAEGAARLDPLFMALAPFDPRWPEPVFPPVPDTLRAAVPEARGEGAAEAEGAAGWAASLVHAFAAGLTGFEGSSLAYLRRQFLARPGTLHLAEGRLTLVLDPLPLGIVLRLAGLHGWSGRLPQANNALMRIEVRDG